MPRRASVELKPPSLDQRFRREFLTRGPLRTRASFFEARFFLRNRLLIRGRLNVAGQNEFTQFALQKCHRLPIIERGLIRQSDFGRLEGTPMNISHDTLLTVTPRLVCGLTFAWILTAMPPGASALNTPLRPAGNIPAKSTAVYKPRASKAPQTYLAMLGPAPLRFAEGERSLPPEPALPAAITLKKPNPPPESAHTNSLATNNPVINPATATPENIEASTPPASNAPKPVSILPDDTRQEIRAEDVLPFFQFPGAPESGAVAVPFTTAQPRSPSPTAPASSATYNLQ